MTHGASGGDVIIKEIAGIKENLRKLDLPARYGGEEFAVILPESDVNNARLIAERSARQSRAGSLISGTGTDPGHFGRSQRSLDGCRASKQMEPAQISREPDAGSPDRPPTPRSLLKHGGRNKATVFTPGMTH